MFAFFMLRINSRTEGKNSPVISALFPPSLCGEESSPLVLQSPAPAAERTEATQSTPTLGGPGMCAWKPQLLTGSGAVPQPWALYIPILLTSRLWRSSWTHEEHTGL